jgi:autotransporter-associated beta strand protein
MAEDDTWQKAFGEKWDAIVLGTGLKECLLSGLLSVAGKKVLHLDRNPYYGGASASLDVTQFFDKMGSSEKPVEAELGKLRDYSIDLIPKFLTAGGNLVKEGGGVLMLGNANTYVGTTTVNNGTLRLGPAGALPNTAVSVTSNTVGGIATLDLDAEYAFSTRQAPLDCFGALDAVRLVQGLLLALAVESSHIVGDQHYLILDLSVLPLLVVGCLPTELSALLFLV